MALAAFVVLALPEAAAAQQWTTSGSDIKSANAGNVGVGDAVPNYKLVVGQPMESGMIHATMTVSKGTQSGASIVVGSGQTSSMEFGWDYANSRAFFNTPGSSPMLFTHNGATVRMFIGGDGKVGVGTAAPGHKLDVQGGQLNASGGLCIAGDCKTSWAQLGSQWATGGSSIFYGGGNVGVGTGSPRRSLQVGSSITLGMLSDYSQIGHNFYHDGAAYRRINAASAAMLQMRDEVIFFTAGSDAADSSFNWAERMRIAANGNVGIGAPVPVSKLDVAGALHVNGVCGGGVPNEQGGYFSWNQRNCSTGEVDFINHQGGGTGGFWFANTANGSTLSSLMVISGNGNVGIGEDSPQVKLAVAGSVTASGTITAANIVAKYQDVAEWVPSTQKLRAGTVVVLDTTAPNHVVASTSAYDTGVAGVVSEQPGMILGEGGEGKVMVATTGRVKVRVDATRAAVRIGDLLVTGEVEGVAMKSEPITVGGRRLHAPGTIVGKALEPLAGGVGEILVLLSLQ
jgi:hypothetical protein